MTDVLLRMLLGATVGLALVLLLRRPARRLSGAGPAFTLWLLPMALMAAPLLPRGLAPDATWTLPALVVTPRAGAAIDAGAMMVWPGLLPGLWLAGAAMGLARLVVHYLLLRHAARRVPADWTAWLADASPGLDPRRVRVHAGGPAVLWALPRSLILLPQDFAERFDNAVTRGLVLRHELTHARRGDACWSLVMEVASALLWCHPLAWLARPRFRLDQELACDAASLRALPEHTANYARALLDSAAVRPVPALIPWLAEPQQKERIAMLTRIPPGALRRRTGFLAIAMLLGGGPLLAAGNSPVEAATHGTSASIPPSVDVVYKQQHLPAYPTGSIKAGEQGTVMLDVTVDAAGRVTGVAVDPKGTTAPPRIQVAAMSAAVRWHFNPGTKDGHPVGGIVRIPLTFSLQSERSCPEGQAHASKPPFQCVPLHPAPAAA